MQSDHLPRSRHMPLQQHHLASRSASFERRMREQDSWVEISSQPSSSSLSSVADEVIPSGSRAPNDPRWRRRRRGLPPSMLNRERRQDGTSSQEEYDESESESDRVMTSSGEALPDLHPTSGVSLPSFANFDDEDENRTAINYPLHNRGGFTPQPNAFSHPPNNPRHYSQPVPGSYFPASSRPAFRQSLTAQSDAPRSSHLPQNILSPSYNAAAQHEEALRASLNTLLSCAAAARGLQKQDPKRNQTTIQEPLRSNRVEPTSLRLIPGPAPPTTLPAQPQQLHHLQEPTFKPTLRRISTSTTASSSSNSALKEKRKALPATRSSSRERRSTKKARRSPSSTSVDDLTISPTLLTWIVSAGVVVFLSALSFTAGYGLGKEAGRLEGANGFATAGGDEQLRNCAREAGRSGLGLKRSLARSAVQV